jgi:hypothetical protein
VLRSPQGRDEEISDCIPSCVVCRAEQSCGRYGDLALSARGFVPSVHAGIPSSISAPPTSECGVRRPRTQNLRNAGQVLARALLPSPFPPWPSLVIIKFRTTSPSPRFLPPSQAVLGTTFCSAIDTQGWWGLRYVVHCGPVDDATAPIGLRRITNTNRFPPVGCGRGDQGACVARPPFCAGLSTTRRVLF